SVGEGQDQADPLLPNPLGSFPGRDFNNADLHSDAYARTPNRSTLSRICSRRVVRLSSKTHPPERSGRDRRVPALANRPGKPGLLPPLPPGSAIVEGAPRHRARREAARLPLNPPPEASRWGTGSPWSPRPQCAGSRTSGAVPSRLSLRTWTPNRTSGRALHL